MGRVQAVVARANKKNTIQLAAGLLAGSTLLSSVLGLFRDRLLNSTYLHTYPTGIDAYTVAFVIPDFLFLIFVTGALSVTFIPVFNQRIARGNKKSAWALSTSVINFMALTTFVVSILIIIFAEPLVRYVVGPGLDESSRALAVSMMRVIAVNPFLFAIAAVIASMQQAVGRFTFYALAPTIYNIGIIIGVIFFTHGINIFGWQVFDGGIMGVALGVVLGSIMQLLVSSIGLFGLGFDYRFKIYWKNKGFRKVLSLLPARSIDQGMDYIVGIVETNLASRMVSGSVRFYQQASTLHMMPINLIGVAVSTAAFPRMTERLAEGRPDLFRRELRSVIRIIAWLILPVSAIAFFARGYVVSFIIYGGDVVIASVLGSLVPAIVFRSIYHIAARSFYAEQDTRTPLIISIIAITLNIALAVWFTLGLNWGVYGLAWAQSIVAGVEVCILFVAMEIRNHGLFNRSFFHALSRMVLATFVSSIVTYILVQLFPFRGTEQGLLQTIPVFLMITVVTGAVYLAMSRLFHLPEADPVLSRIYKIFFAMVKR